MQKLSNSIVTVSLLITLSNSISATPSGKFDYLSLSLGTWIVTNDNTGASGKNSFFQSARIFTAYHIGPVKGSISIPLAFTLENYPDRLLYAVYPGNQEMTFGISIGNIQPRVGISFPLGYPVRGTAWIGSGNINALMGMGFRAKTFHNKKISLGGELLTRISLTDTSDGARFGRGSMSGYLSIKSGIAFQKWNFAGGLFLSGSYHPYTDWGGREQGAAIVPTISVKRQLSKKMGLSIKGGAGPGWSGTDWEKKQLNVTSSVSFETGL